MEESKEETLPYWLIRRKKKGIAAIVTLGAKEEKFLRGMDAEEFACEKAEFVLQAAAKLIDEAVVSQAEGVIVKEYCFVKHRLELF